MFSLKDKVALITGASQGIGRDTALALAAAGAKVAVAARNEEKLLALVEEIKSAGGEALAIKMDVADPDQVKAGFKAVIEKFARLDILVNNAAITKDGLALRMKPEDWNAVISTNLTGAHFCTQQALAIMMRARAGRIINISSIVAEMGNAGQSNYVASKAGLIGLTKAIAIEIASTKYHSQRRSPRLHRNSHDRCPQRRSKRRPKKTHPARPHGHAARRNRRHNFPGQRRSRLHHRPRPGRKRRHVPSLSSTDFSLCAFSEMVAQALLPVRFSQSAFIQTRTKVDLAHCLSRMQRAW